MKVYIEHDLATEHDEHYAAMSGIKYRTIIREVLAMCDKQQLISTENLKMFVMGLAADKGVVIGE